jgi:3-oxoacyl-[acyl-carrier protein] reductase
LTKLFENENIVIVGGFRGMGFELAKLVLSQKANVFLIGRTNKNGKKAQNSLIDYKDQLTIFVCNLSDNKILSNLEKNIDQWCSGTLHHLTIFLGSGKTPFGFDFSIQHWHKVFHTNLYTPIEVINNLIPLMCHGKGHPSITLTGAIAAVERVRAPMTYSIAKTALVAYSNHLAEALVDKGVRVNTVSPGNVFYKDGRWEEIIADKGDEIYKFINEDVGMKRFGTSVELAMVYYYIMSSANSFMTGQNIIADGLQTRKLF